MCMATIIVDNYDHVPLVSLVKKPIDKIKNNRRKILSLKLLPYSFKLEYVPGSELFLAVLET